MLQSAMLACYSLPVSPLAPCIFLRIRTYKPPLPQPVYHHHLQASPKSIHSKAPTSPAESTLTQLSAPNPFILRTYKKPGGGVPPRLPFSVHTSKFRMLQALFFETLTDTPGVGSPTPQSLPKTEPFPTHNSTRPAQSATGHWPRLDASPFPLHHLSGPWRSIRFGISHLRYKRTLSMTSVPALRSALR